MQVRVDVPKQVLASAKYVGAMANLTIPEVLGKELAWLAEAYTLLELVGIASGKVDKPNGEPRVEAHRP